MLSGLALTAGIGFVQSVIITRALGPDLLGVWSICLVFALTIFGFLGFRTHDAATRSLAYRSDEQREEYGAVISLAVSIELLVSIVALGITVLVATAGLPLLTDDPAAGDLIVFVAVAQAALALERPTQGIARYFEQERVIASIAVGVAATRCLVLASLWWYAFLDLHTLALVTLAIACLQFTIQAGTIWVFCRRLNLRARDLSPIRAWRLRHRIEDFLHIMTRSFLTSSVSTVFKQADVLLLGAWRSDTEVGYYRLAKNLCTFIMSGGNAMAFAIFNDLSRLTASNDGSRAVSTVRRSLWTFGPVSIMAFLAAVGLAPLLIPAVYGHAYEPSVLLFQILVGATSVQLLLFWAFPLLIAQGKEMLYLVMISVVTLAMLALSIVILPSTQETWPMAAIMTSLWTILFGWIAYEALRQLKRRATIDESSKPRPGLEL